MLRALANLGSFRNAARTYANRAAISRLNAAATRRAAGAQAETIRDTAKRNQELAGKNIRTARENQADELATIRNAQGTSGLLSTGTGNTRAIAAQQALDAQIANMAQSASISMSNAWEQANATERQGNMSALAIESEAAAYSAAARSIRSGANVSLLGGLVAGAYSLSAQPAGTDIKTTLLRGYNAFGAGAGIAADFNSYTAAMNGDANNRKMNWGWLTSINNGNIPYNPDLKTAYFPRTS